MGFQGHTGRCRRVVCGLNLLHCRPLTGVRSLPGWKTFWEIQLCPLMISPLLHIMHGNPTKWMHRSVRATTMPPDSRLGTTVVKAFSQQWWSESACSGLSTSSLMCTPLNQVYIMTVAEANVLAGACLLDLQDGTKQQLSLHVPQVWVGCWSIQTWGFLGDSTALD